MDRQQKPKGTPLMFWKIFGLANCIALGFGAAYYAEAYSMSYVIAPVLFLEISCTSCLVLICLYLRGVLFQGHNPNIIKACFWLGWVLLCISIVGCFYFVITGLAKIEGFVYERYGLYAALVPCLLAVFWSSVLIHDARVYWRMWQGISGGAMAGVHVIYLS